MDQFVSRRNVKIALYDQVQVIAVSMNTNVETWCHGDASFLDTLCKKYRLSVALLISSFTNERSSSSIFVMLAIPFLLPSL